MARQHNGRPAAQALMLHPKPGTGLADVWALAGRIADEFGVPVAFWLAGDIHRVDPYTGDDQEPESLDADADAELERYLR